MLQNKRTILIVGAILFVVVIFLLKNNSIYKNHNSQDAASIYGNLSVKDLVDVDTDGDGVTDWEESLWGTDPTKKDTNADGVPDSVEIEKIKRARGVALNGDAENSEDTPLTQTDKFSRELLSTVAALNQTGGIDQGTVEKITDSLANKIQNPEIRKTYTSANIKIGTDDSANAYKDYSASVDNLSVKYPINGNTMDILQEFIGDGENVNPDALKKLDPIIKQTQQFIYGLVNIKTPPSLATLHLGTINALEQLTENLTDIQLYDTDPVVAMGAMSKYQENTDALQAVTDKISAVIISKVN
ncbi:thrombospondin type 3 repeat-containing protein [Patescibacteria group bacterium]|nr:thrombospondin type 3 repeat-containing protein [Patescibacteria group bacterium]